MSGKSQASVGYNDKAPCNPCTSVKLDLYAPVGGGDVTFTAQDLIDRVVAAGSVYPDGTAVVAVDTIHSIDADLKYIGGEGMWGGNRVTATTSQAVYTVNGGQTDLDPGGSRCDAQEYNGCPATSLFEDITIDEGSIVTISLLVLKS